MEELLAEKQFGTGFVHREPEPTDRVFQAGASEPVDWQRGYDIRDELKKKLGSSFRMPINNQYQQLSCVGQAWSKYAGVLKVMKDPNPNWVEFSSRDPYSHIYLPQGGAYIIQGGLFIRNRGILPYEQLPSHWSGKPNIPGTEEVMRDRGLEGGKESGDNANPNIYDSLRQLVKGGSVEDVAYDIDSIAKAIRDNHGCVIGVYGENNGTWFSKFPRVGAMSWGHALYAMGFIYINGKKYIIVANSWGNGVGEGGYQFLGEEWFGNNRYIGGANTISPEVGNILRMSDLQRLYDMFEMDGTLNENYGANWDEIMLTSPVQVTYTDFQNYCALKKLI